MIAFSFEDRLLAKLKQQIKGRKVGFLLGAGASYLSGRGYPLAAELWLAIKHHMPPADQAAIDDRMAPAGLPLEVTLDLLDVANGSDDMLRQRVTTAIGAAFAALVPPLDEYRSFIQGLAARHERTVNVFSLNYDCLVERAADSAGLALTDGFRGHFEANFQPENFLDAIGRYESRRNRLVFVPRQGIIHLYKLHGSLGWYSDGRGRITRIRPDLSHPAGQHNLMVPPQHRKAADTGYTPYATLWSEFRAYLTNDAPRLLNRLVCVGYGLADGHVNAVLDAALQREHFTLIVLARALSDQAFSKYAASAKAIVVTETRSSLYKEQGPGLPNAWSFEWLSREV